MFGKKNIFVLCGGVLLFFFVIINARAEVVAKEVILDNQKKVEIYLFERDGCSFCAKEVAWFQELSQQRNDFNLTLIDIDQIDNRRQFDLVTDEHNLPKVTPTTIVGDVIFQGFESGETTGTQIIDLIEQVQQLQGTGTTTIPVQNYEFKIPFWGVVDLKDFSLLSLSFILGLVDGFNPCAMWVLMSFLLILWQIKDRRKMLQVVSIFIVAEAIMYWLILNLWYQTWDFIQLDKIITPVVGLLAIGGGSYFLFRYFKNRGKLVCKTDVEKQGKTEVKIQKLISSPLTILTTLGIIGVAFSVNIVEFACSVGIPQAFTKILEINNLSALGRQFYIALYTVAYLIDDLIVFSLALYGFSKFYAVGQRYSNLSSLIGGVLMLILGGLLLLSPQWLVF